MTTTAFSKPVIGATTWRTDAPNLTRQYRRVVRPESWDLLPAGWFVLECGLETRTYGHLTGRTRRQWGMDCPTIERFEIATVVRDLKCDGNHAIYGEPGERIPGTWAIRPDMLA